MQLNTSLINDSTEHLFAKCLPRIVTSRAVGSRKRRVYGPLMSLLCDERNSGASEPGLRIGGVLVSEKHANFLVNDQKGTATDLRRLSDRVRAEVSRRSGIELVEEVVYLGDWGDWQPEVQP